MANIYVIGAADGPAFLGQDERPVMALAEALERFPDKAKGFTIGGDWPLREPTAITLILRIVRGWLEAEPDTWINRPMTDLTKSVEDAYQLVTDPSITEPAGIPHFGKALRHVRETVFEVSQPIMARLMGVSSASYSRWEAGQRVPDIRDLARLCKFAAIANIKFDPSMIFDEAEASGNPSPVAKAGKRQRKKGGTNGKENA